ncbi:hypothetical protein ANO11243_057740 [Dothideomycetidae sp. 11243]|nr:hypothetical protein ANO11243_057740 [fungal sp. No.11243]
MAPIVVKGGSTLVQSLHSHASVFHASLLETYILRYHCTGVRPTKKAEVPPPLYLTAAPGEEPSYCHACGRLIGSHKLKSGASSSTTARYCSERCKRHKPSSNPGSLDRAIEDTLYLLLNETTIPEIISALPESITQHHDTTQDIEDTRRRSTKKGETRLVVPCSLVESIIFSRLTSINRAQNKRNVRKTLEPEVPQHNDKDYDEAALTATLARLKARQTGTAPACAPDPTAQEGATDTVPSASDEDDDNENEDEAPPTQAEGDDAKRKQGQQRATERERVRNACRRAVIFGLLPPGMVDTRPLDAVPKQQPEEEEPPSSSRAGKARKAREEAHKRTKSGAAEKEQGGGGRRRCEAVMRGAVVEPSYAKGEWGVRWAEV